MGRDTGRALALQSASRLLAWFDRHRRDLPWRRTGDLYRIWVAEIMLQQTQVPTVIPYFRRFVSAFPNVQALAGASLDEVLRLWEFPQVEPHGHESATDALARLFAQGFGLRVEVGGRLCTLTHGVTNRRVGLTAYWCAVRSGRMKAQSHVSAKWVGPQDLDEYAMPARHRRIAGVLGEHDEGQKEGRKREGTRNPDQSQRRRADREHGPRGAPRSGGRRRGDGADPPPQA